MIVSMTDLVVHTDAPASILPYRTYNSADEWYSTLADMYMAQLAFRHNAAIEDESDARNKYVARQLFRKLATEGRLTSELDSDGSFRLFSEDSRRLIQTSLRILAAYRLPEGERWEKRTWMISYAARKSWDFDFIWRKYLDESYFGSNDNQD